MPSKRQQKPKALRSGDKIGIVAPASNISREMFAAGCERLTQMGYEPVYSERIFEQDLYFAGKHEAQAREIEEMFQRADVRAVLCARGGYGSNYLLPLIDLEIVRKNPKIFMGYSDITSLLTYFHDATGLVTFHGPMLTKDFANVGGIDVASFASAIGGETAWQLATNDASTLVAGEAEGVLYGGCLSILTASLGTPYEIQTEGKLLFIEDIAAKPYQIDRMLMQLKLAGKLKGVRGLIFGAMLDCVQNVQQDYTLEEVITRVVGDLSVPVAIGVNSGHVLSRNLTLPFGVRAKLAAGKRVTLNILEAATEKHG